MSYSSDSRAVLCYTLAFDKQRGLLASRQVACSVEADRVNFAESRLFRVLPSHERTLRGEHVDHV